jgi:RNA polymerase sigma-70 factor (ECF subfamily)
MSKWIEKYSRRLWNFIKQRVENEDDAWDIFQETLISASESLPTFSGKSPFFTWLGGIAKHEISDFYRKKKIKTILFSHLPWLENLASQALGPEQILLRKEFEQRVRQTLENLSEEYSQILRLKYYEGLTIVEIAQKLNETVSAIESRLFRARKAFAKAFSANSS